MNEPYILPEGISVNDLKQFEPIATCLVQTAKGYGGKFVVAGIWEKVIPLDNGQKKYMDVLTAVHVLNKGKPEHIVAKLLNAANTFALQLRRNVTTIPALMREDLAPGKKGGEEDVIGVLAVPSDFDPQTETNTRRERLPLPPHAEVATSPGLTNNTQPWLFFDRPYPVAEVKPVLVALMDKLGCDHASKDASHLYRVPGTLNWPNHTKRTTHKRSPNPVMAQLVTVPDPALDSITLEQLKAAMEVKWPDVFSQGSSTSSAETTKDFDWNKSNGNLAARLNEGTIQKRLHTFDEGTDRSAVAFAFMNMAKRCSHTAEEVVQMFLRYPSSPIAAHYKDEAHLRADVVRAFTKKDRRPQREGSKVFRLLDADEPAPIREVQIIGGNLPLIIDRAEQGLIEQRTDLYQRGSMIVRPSLHEVIEASKGRTTRGTRLIPVKLAGMIEHLTAAVDFRRYEKDSDTWRSVDCPKEIAAAYLEREGRWKLRRLTGTINAPTLRADGSILETPGYDEATGIYYHPGSASFLPILPEPSREDAERALALLKDLISTFPFTSEASRSVALSGMLTAVVRRSLPFAPLHGYSAPAPGTGKSKLVDTNCMLAAGHMAPVIAQGGTEEELEKRLGASLIAGDGIISLDNCTRPLDSAFLCQILTQAIAKVRVLGLSKVIDVPGNAAMYATGNNLTIIGDLTRRVLRCEIDAKIERPELREFAQDPVAVVSKERPRYTQAALTILRAWAIAGRQGKAAPLGGFVEWSRMVRDALTWLGEADPCDTIEMSRGDDPERIKHIALMEAWSAAIGERRVTVKEVIAAAGIGNADNPATALGDALKAIAASFARTGDILDPTRLGRYLSNYAGRVAEGMVLVKEPKLHGRQLWRLEHRF